MTAQITGYGHYVPERRVTSSALEKRLSLSPGWIEKRTGVVERRFAAPDQAVTDLARHAAQMALADADIPGSEIGLLILATSTPDHLLPPSAPRLAHMVQCNGAAMDLAGACTGFVYALSLADGFVRTQGGKALIVGANVLSRRIDPDDRASSVLFGDGAGAVIIAGTDPNADRAEAGGMLGLHLSSRGEHYDLIKVSAGGSRNPFAPDMAMNAGAIKLSDGGAAFSAAIASLVETSERALVHAGLSVDDIDAWVPHQANRRIIEAAAKKLDIGLDKTLFTISHWGNSSAATIPLTLSHYWHTGRLKRGNVVLMSAVGAGFTEGSIVYRL